MGEAEPVAEPTTEVVTEASVEGAVPEAPASEAPKEPTADPYPAWEGWQYVRERPWYKTLPAEERERVWDAFEALGRKAQLAELLGEPERDQQLAEMPKLREELAGVQASLATLTTERDTLRTERDTLRAAHEDSLVAMADYRHRLHYPDLYDKLDANGKGAYADFVQQCDVEFSKLGPNATSAQVQEAEERAAKMIRALLPQAKAAPDHARKPAVQPSPGTKAGEPKMSLKDKVAQLRAQGGA